MNMKCNMEDFLKNAIKHKEDIVAELIFILKSTDDFYEGNQIALALTEHFRDDRIETCLVDLIQSPKWKMHNGTLLFALKEYTSNSKYLYFLIDMLLKNEKDDNGEVFMETYSMIINMHPPLDKKEITRSLQRVKREMKKKNISEEQRKVVYSLLNYLDGQREITKFYSKFLTK